MGGMCGKPADAAASAKSLIVLVIGLDNSGKTTLTQALKGDMDPAVVPTVGFSAPVTKRMHGSEVTFYDLGGGARIRGVWPSYFAEVHGVVYVVDAADEARLVESAAELATALVHPMIVGKPVLIFANKQDLPQAMNEADISSTMGLDRLATLCRHHVQACVAKPSANGGVFDERVNAGLRWLVEAVRVDMRSLNVRRKKEMEEFAAAERTRREKQAASYAEAKARREQEENARAATTQQQETQERADEQPVNSPSSAAADAASHDEHRSASETVASPTNAKTVEIPTGTDSQQNNAPASPASTTGADPTPVPAPVAAPAPAPAPASLNVILCTVCKTRPAVRRAGVIGWQAGCDECITARTAAVEAAKRAAEEEEARREAEVQGQQ